MIEVLGWVKVFREMEEWEWYHDSKMVHLFLHLLLRANHKPRLFEGVEIKRGQVVTGLHSLHRDTGISIQSLRTNIKRLKSTHEITIKPTNRFSVVTITNYERYQGDTPGSNKENNKQSNKRVTINQQTSNNKQECKNDKNVKKVGGGKDTWLTVFISIWKEETKGNFPMGEGAKALRPVVNELGQVKTGIALRQYLKTTPPRYLSISRFAQKAGMYLPKGQQSKHEAGW